MIAPGAEGGPPPLPVVLEDRTGLVTAIGQPALAGEFSFRDGVTNMPGRMDQLAVTWLTGACTLGSHMTFEPIDGGYRLSVADRDSGGACILIGYGRTMTIDLDAPVDAGTVQFVELE